MPSASAVSIPENLFNPYELRPLASLNRRRLIPLPGLDPAWAGKTGWDLCSSPALIQLIQDRAAELGLGEVALSDLPLRLNELLFSPDPAVQAAARAIAEIHGQRLGGLVASILRSPAGLSSPLDPWEAAYLRHWREEVRQLFLGGGLANGRLGEIIALQAEAMLRACGIQQLKVQPARFPSYLPLIGAARRLPPGDGRVAAVADFGSTWAKRALAYYRAGGELEKLRILPPVKVAPLVDAGNAGQLAAEMVAFLADTIRQAGLAAHLAPDLVCSLAAYVVDGQPAPQTGSSSGGYYALHAVSNDLCGWFTEQVSLVALASAPRVGPGGVGQEGPGDVGQESPGGLGQDVSGVAPASRVSGVSGRPVRVQFAHDGSAAAAALAGQEKAAVIMLGSALGVGFVPPGVRIHDTIECS